MVLSWVHQHHRVALVQPAVRGPIARVLDAVVVGRAGEFAFLTSSRVKWMLLAQDHILGNTVLLQYLDKIIGKKNCCDDQL